MDFVLHTNPTANITDMTLTATEGEKLELDPYGKPSDSAEGTLKTQGQNPKHHKVTPRTYQATSKGMPLPTRVQNAGKTLPKAFVEAKGKPTPMRLATLSHPKMPISRTRETPPPLKEGKVFTPKSLSPPLQKKALGEKKAPPKGRERTECSKTRTASRERSQEKGTLQMRKWNAKKSEEFWTARYQEREQEKDREGGNKRHKDETEEVQGVQRKGKDFAAGEIPSFRKPLLERPKTGVFALYYILTKIGIRSDGASNYAYKKEVEQIDSDTTTAHQKRLDEMKKAIEHEESGKRWGVATKVFSWMASLIGIITGIALIVTGVGAVAGAMLIAAGLIQVTNQVLELTGGWHKIAKLLPGNDPEKKKAVITWMQIGVSVLCLILSGVGAVCGGLSNFGETMQQAMAVFGGVVVMGQGVTNIGEGVTAYFFKNKISDIRRYDIILAKLKHRRKDLMEKVDWGVDRLEQLFEDLARVLDFYDELFYADQSIIRR